MKTWVEMQADPTTRKVAQAITDCYKTKSEWRLRLRQAEAAMATLRALGWKPPEEIVTHKPATAS